MKDYAKISILGILAAFAAVVAEQLLAIGAQFFSGKEAVLTFYQNITWFLAGSVVFEEALKYATLYTAIWQRLGIQGKKFLGAGFLFGISFGLTEAALIIFADPETGILARNFDSETLISLSSIVLIQTATSLLITALLAAQEQIKRFSYIKILAFPVLIHLLYNFLVIQKGDYTNFLVLTTLIVSYLVSFSVIVFSWQKLD